MSALKTQVGGDHYKGMAIQPMEYSMANGLDACQHTAIKYITRFRQKGGITDLEKAKHSIDMLIEFELAAAADADGRTDQAIKAAAFNSADDPVQMPVEQVFDPSKHASADDVERSLERVSAALAAYRAGEYPAARQPLTVEPAAAIDDDSPRMQAIAQNGNDGLHYPAPCWHCGAEDGAEHRFGCETVRGL